LSSCEERKKKIEIDPISTDKRQRQILAVYGSNGTEFSYGFLVTTEYNNGTTPIWLRNNGNVMLETRRNENVSQQSIHQLDCCETFSLRLVSSITLPLFRSHIGVVPLLYSVVTKKSVRKFRSVRAVNGKNLPLSFVG